jgi:hypothetical protein
MNIKIYSTIINKSIGLALISSINSFLISPALSQQVNCSNYWVKPSTGKVECLDRNMGLILESEPVKPKSEMTSKTTERSNTRTSELDACNSLTNSLKQSYCKLASLLVGKEKLNVAARNSISKNVDYTETCQAIVRERMKAPATTQFVDGNSTEIFPGVYVIMGKVDSQNGYGALIRGDYTCVFSDTPGYESLNSIYVS